MDGLGLCSCMKDKDPALWALVVKTPFFLFSNLLVVNTQDYYLARNQNTDIHNTLCKGSHKKTSLTNAWVKLQF